MNQHQSFDDMITMSSIKIGELHGKLKQNQVTLVTFNLAHIYTHINSYSCQILELCIVNSPYTNEI